MEFEWQNKYNPFNSLKALCHVEYWKQIFTDYEIPPPRFVSIDPCNACNFACHFCNAHEVLQNNTNQMSYEIMLSIVRLLKQWRTRAVCIGGGGESLLNPDTAKLIVDLTNADIQVGLVTNGTMLDDNRDSLLRWKWIGVSLDAAKSETHMWIKGLKQSVFQHIIKNIEALANRGTEISYKFLLHPRNCNEVYAATKLAKEIGCNLIHIRPGADAWFNQSKKEFTFTAAQVLNIQDQIINARQDFEDASFKIYGITHKFDGNLQPLKSFSKCYACLTTCFINSMGEIGLCCDRRGDDQIMLGNVDNICDVWGSERHWEIHQNINVSACPRCTYSEVNNIFENVVIKDTMMYNMF